jgi:outer membrane lipoprotein-sorting protein
MKNPIHTLASFLLLLAVNTICNPSIAQNRITDEEQARAIFEEVDDRRATLESETALMNMTITDDRGRTRNRTMQSWNRNDGDITESLIIFTEPGNVRGTGFLSVNEGGSSTQRLYLPAVGRIQVIGSAERGDRFMGSDFTYEDLGDQDPDSYEFEWLEEYEDYYKIRATKPDSDQYAFIEFEVTAETYTVRTIYYYNDQGELIKRLEADDFQQLTDSLWSPSKMTMYDLREGRNTEITWSDRQVNASIEDWRFTERGLRRGI